MILIYPPVAKISEPPPGVAILAGALKRDHIHCKVIDANVAGMMWLARYPATESLSDLSTGSIKVASSFDDNCEGEIKKNKVDSRRIVPTVDCLNKIISKVGYSSRIIHGVDDSWTRRSVTHLDRNLSDLKDINVYKNMARYRQRVMDLNRAITTSVKRHNNLIPERFTISLSDYTDTDLTPVKSEDLITSARQYKQNPFYPFFETYLASKIQEHSFQGYSFYTESDCLATETLSFKTKSDLLTTETPSFRGESGILWSGISSSVNRSDFVMIENLPPDYIGISLCYLSQALTAFALAGWIRARFPQKRIVMGGGLVTSWMSMPTWNDPFKGLIDCMVRGRGEESLISMCNEDRGSDHKNSEHKDSSGYRHNPSHKKNQSYKPDFDFCKWDQYISPGRVLPFRTASGCYWNRCRFCPEKAEGNQYQPENNMVLLDNLQQLIYRYRPSYIHFIDDAISPSFLKALVSFTSHSVVSMRRQQ
ncbi:MAG: hypothetical protein HQK65_10095, partial [Desulfamplus sp.]|nr:hypothetical protein [Desulfamplus sp.]